VRWSPTRICLEAFEVKVPGVSVRVSNSGSGETFTLATWLVGKGSTFVRVGVGEGVEWRQPLDCTVGASGP
jgi:hypothetical protein